jgi:hypothetical protein
MKNLKIVLFSVLTLGLALTTSCSDDDSSSNNTSGVLEGKWILDKEGQMVQGHEILLNYEHQEGCDKDYLEVTETSFTEAYHDSECSIWGGGAHTYTREGNTITVDGTDGNEDTVYTIKTLTGTDLKVEYTETMGDEATVWVDTYKRG